jgi:predicted transposase YbfD/YdcC
VRRVNSTTTHGAWIEARTIAVSGATRGLSDWPGLLAQVLKLERTVTNKTTGEMRQETIDGMSSLSSQQALPAQLNGLCRGPWTSENKLHWVRDVTFDGDCSTVRSGNAPQAMAAIRNMVISLPRLRKEDNIAAALRKYAAQPAITFPHLAFER